MAECDVVVRVTPSDELRPILSEVGRFLIPLCVTLEETQDMIDALYYARGLCNPCDDWRDMRALDVLLMALRNVGLDPSEWGECAIMNCEELTECLQPLFDAINDALASMQTSIGQLAQSTDNSTAKAPPKVEANSDPEFVYSGALEVVRYMHRQNMKYYNLAEESTPDNLNEATETFVEAIPILGDLPFDELFGLVDSHFQNEVSAYVAAYDDMEEPAAFDLYCRIVAAGEFTYLIWGDWLNALETTVPTNAAATLFARYAPIRQTFLNQIAALLNKSQSLEEYFKQIYQQFVTGQHTFVSLPIGYSCADPEILYFDPAPPVAGLTLNNDGGAFGAVESARYVTSPFIVELDMGASYEVNQVTVTAAFGLATGAYVRIGLTDYDLVQGYNYPGSATYDYVADIPNVETDVMEIHLGSERAISMIQVSVNP